MVDLQRSVQRFVFPFLEIAYQTKPRAMATGLEHQFVVCGIGRLQQEHLNERSCLLAEMKTGLDNLGVIEDHQGSLWQIVRKMTERVFTNLAMSIDQQFRLVTLGQRELGNPFVGQVVIIVVNSYMFCIHSYMLNKETCLDKGIG